jgi:RNA polymerase sigma-70 factor, ECF subfamily
MVNIASWPSARSTRSSARVFPRSNSARIPNSQSSNKPLLRCKFFPARFPGDFPASLLRAGIANRVTILGTFMAAHASYNEEPQRSKLDFDSLVELHYGALYRFAMSLTRAESDACDLVQQTFLTWATKGHQLEDPSKVKSWLYTTLHRAFLESRRRVTRFPHLEISKVEAELPTVGPDLVSQLDAADVLGLLGHVDDQFQAAVALFYLEDYSYNEIAAILEVPLGTVKSRIARGLAQLRELVLRTAPHGRGTKEEVP